MSATRGLFRAALSLFRRADAKLPPGDFEPILDPDLALEHPLLQTLLQHYRSLCGGREMPAWSEFKPNEVPPDVLPLLLVLDVTPERPADYRWRLMGTGITATVERDTTGRTFEQLYKGRIYRRMLLAPRWILEHRRPLRSRSSGAFVGAKPRPSENLFLPFADTEGRICRILFALAFDPPAED